MLQIHNTYYELLTARKHKFKYLVMVHEKMQTYALMFH